MYIYDLRTKRCKHLIRNEKVEMMVEYQGE